MLRHCEDFPPIFLGIACRMVEFDATLCLYHSEEMKILANNNLLPEWGSNPEPPCLQSHASATAPRRCQGSLKILLSTKRLYIYDIFTVGCKI